MMLKFLVQRSLVVLLILAGLTLFAFEVHVLSALHEFSVNGLQNVDLTNMFEGWS